jgi:micrococcal nuclease
VGDAFKSSSLRSEDVYEYRARIVHVYDGDTVYADIDLGFKHTMHDVHLRLFGINTPEVTGEDRELGLVAKSALVLKVLNKVVTIRTIKPTKDVFPASDKTEKYGRYLAVIILEDGTDVNKWLVDNNYASVYLP